MRTTIAHRFWYPGGNDLKIGDLFVKDISRTMNPVIKVNDLDDSALYQELEEYVVTKDIDRNSEVVTRITLEFGFPEISEAENLISLKSVHSSFRTKKFAVRRP